MDQDFQQNTGSQGASSQTPVQDQAVSHPADSTLVSNQPPIAAPVAPVSPPQKEQAGMASTEPPPEFIKPSEKAPEISPEASEAGLKEISEELKLTPEHEKIGVRLAKEAVPVATEPSGIVQLLKEVEAKDGQKKGVGNSIRWLFTLLLKVSKHLKTMHQKIVNP